MNNLKSDPGAAATLMFHLADHLENGVGFYGAFIDACSLAKLGQTEPTFYVAEQFTKGVASWMDLLDGVVPDEVLPSLRLAKGREETVVALRKAAAQLASAAQTQRLQLQLPNTDLEAKFLALLSGRLGEGMSVYVALLDVVCVLRLGFEKHVAHLSAQFEAGRYALSEVLDGVVSAQSLAAIRTGEHEGDVTSYLSLAAEALSSDR
jgi:hypothetical protein